MTEGQRYFINNGQTDAISASDADKYLKDYPDAKEVVHLDLGDKGRSTIDIDDLPAIMKDYPTAKPFYAGDDPFGVYNNTVQKKNAQAEIYSGVKYKQPKAIMPGMVSTQENPIAYDDGTEKVPLVDAGKKVGYVNPPTKPLTELPLPTPEEWESAQVQETKSKKDYYSNAINNSSPFGNVPSLNQEQGDAAVDIIKNIPNDAAVGLATGADKLARGVVSAIKLMPSLAPGISGEDNYALDKAENYLTKRIEHLKTGYSKNEASNAIGGLISTTAEIAGIALSKNPELGTALFTDLGWDDGGEVYDKHIYETKGTSNEFTRLAMQGLYSALYALPYHNIIKGASSPVVEATSKFTQKIFSSNPEVAVKTATDLLERAISDNPVKIENLLSRATAEGASGAANMAVMNLGTQLVNYFGIDERKSFGKRLEDVAGAAGTGFMLSGVMAPYVAFAQNKESIDRWNKQGTVAFTTDAKNNTVEVLPDGRGLTNDGRFVDVTPDMKEKIFYTSSDIINKARTNKKLGNAQIPIEQEAHEFNIDTKVKLLPKMDGNIVIATLADGSKVTVKNVTANKPSLPSDVNNQTEDPGKYIYTVVDSKGNEFTVGQNDISNIIHFAPDEFANMVKQNFFAQQGKEAPQAEPTQPTEPTTEQNVKQNVDDISHTENGQFTGKIITATNSDGKKYYVRSGNPDNPTSDNPVTLFDPETGTVHVATPGDIETYEPISDDKDQYFNVALNAELQQQHPLQPEQPKPYTEPQKLTYNGELMDVFHIDDQGVILKDSKGNMFDVKPSELNQISEFNPSTGLFDKQDNTHVSASETTHTVPVQVQPTQQAAPTQPQPEVKRLVIDKKPTFAYTTDDKGTHTFDLSGEKNPEKTYKDITAYFKGKPFIVYPITQEVVVPPDNPDFEEPTKQNVLVGATVKKATTGLPMDNVQLPGAKRQSDYEAQIEADKKKKAEIEAAQQAADAGSDKPTIEAKQPTQRKTFWQPSKEAKERASRDPMTPEEAVLQYFVVGGKINKDDFIRLTGWGNDPNSEHGKTELKAYRWLWDENGTPVDELSIATDTPMMESYVEREGANAVQQVVADVIHNNLDRTAMLERLRKIQDMYVMSEEDMDRHYENMAYQDLLEHQEQERIEYDILTTFVDKYGAFPHDLFNNDENDRRAKEIQTGDGNPDNGVNADSRHDQAGSPQNNQGGVGGEPTNAAKEVTNPSTNLKTPESDGKSKEASEEAKGLLAEEKEPSAVEPPKMEVPVGGMKKLSIGDTVTYKGKEYKIEAVTHDVENNEYTYDIADREGNVIEDLGVGEFGGEKEPSNPVFARDILNQPKLKEGSKSKPSIDSALDDFLKDFGYDDNIVQEPESQYGEGQQLSPEQKAKILMSGMRLVDAFTNAGVYKFSDIVKGIESKGINVSPEMLIALKQGYSSYLIDHEDERLDDIKTVRAYNNKPVFVGDQIKKATEKKELEDINRNFDEKNNNDVHNRPGSSEPDRADSPAEVQKDGDFILDGRNPSGPVRKSSNGGNRKTVKRGNRAFGSGLFAPVPGEPGDNQVYQDNSQPSIEEHDAGDFDGRGSRVDGIEGQVNGAGGDNGNHEDHTGVPETFKQRTEKRLIQQKQAEPIPVKTLDRDNIAATLPYLLPEQHDDVFKAEKRFFSDDHKTDALAHGKGFLFTNGTGTGKTLTGLGIIKRFDKQGKSNILIVVPSEQKIVDWIKEGNKLQVSISVLTNTKDSGSGINVTTYANFRANEALKNRDLDLIVYDESHRLMEDKNGTASSTTSAHYQNSNVSKWQAFNRITSVHPVWVEYAKLNDEYRVVNQRLNNDTSPNPEEDEYRVKQIKRRIETLEEKKKELTPELQKRADKAYENTKVVFLSATPFKTHFNLRYANKTLFDWGDATTYESASRGQSRVDAESRFFLDNFGSAYEWKFHRLQQKPNANADAIAMQEIAFAENLIDKGVMSGRAIESEKDYSREFPLVTLDNAEVFNKALSDIFNYETKEFDGLMDAARKVFYNYNYTTQLFESLKASMVIPRIHKHLDLGRKIVVFHRRKQSNVLPPFQSIIDNATSDAKAVLSNELASPEEKDKAAKKLTQVENFTDKYKSLLEFEKTLNYSPAVDQLLNAFGSDRVVFINGDTPKSQKPTNIERFNNDDSGVDIIVVQEEAGKEGISLHDTSGKKQRVLMSLSMPISSTTALQIEGRIFRIGQETNAIFENPLLGLNMEIENFGRNVNKKLSTTENLAIGNQARDLIRSFAEGVLEHSDARDPHAEQGTGGKEYDKKIQEQLSEFRKAVLVYETNQKKRGRRDQREGIDYYATPEPIGQKMVEWLGLKADESALEPSAGHGAIAMWFPDYVSATSIEPSYGLFSKLNVRAGGGTRKIVNDTFENFSIVNKFNGIAMNPPFGSGGKTAMDHVEKAFSQLKNNGRIVAIVPVGGMDKRMDEFLYGEDKNGNLLNPSANLIAEIILPRVTFDQAGTQVGTRIVVIDKNDMQSEYHIKEGLRKENFQKALNGGFLLTADELNAEAHRLYLEQKNDALQKRTYDFSGAKTIKDLFDSIEDIELTERRRSPIEAEQGSEDSPIAHVGDDHMLALPYRLYSVKHTKTGEDLPLVELTKRISSDEYQNIKTTADKFGGFWDKYNKAFRFPDTESRQKFVDKIFMPDNEVNEPETKYGSNTVNEIIGEYGAKNLDKAEEVTTRLDNLNVAREMEGADKTPQEMRLATGWEKGIDGLWRYEIPDIDLSDDIEKAYNQGRNPSVGAYLRFAIKDNGLFDAYPELLKTKIEVRDIEKGEAKGSFQLSNNTIVINRLLDRDAFKSTLIHEIQHAIQEIEGFAKGGNREAINKYRTANNGLLSAINKVDATVKFDEWVKDNKDILMPLLKNSKGDVMDLIRKKFAATLPERTATIYLDKIKQAKSIYVENQIAIGGDKAIGLTDYEIYHRLSGEVEARNAQTRINLTDEQRRQKLLSETADVAPEDQIILMNGLGVSHSESKPNYRKISDAGFYSTVEDALNKVHQDKGTPEQFKAMLLKNGAKQAEMDWMGWDEEFATKRTVTKSDIQQWIDENRINVKEVVIGGMKPKATKENITSVKFSQHGSGSYIVKYNVEGDTGIVEIGALEADDKNEAIEQAIKRINNSHSDYVSQNTKHSQWVEKGGENYKEFVLTMPNQIEPYKPDDTHFTDEGNGTAVVWVRADDRIDKQRNKILFLEEVQSKRGQDGREKGFSNKAFTFTTDNTTVELSPIGGAYRLMYNGVQASDITKETGDGFSKDDLHRELVMLANKYSRDSEQSKVPTMPFQKTDQWVNLAMRRMMKYAADNGYDAIAWTNGDMQADRYSLSKRYDGIEIIKSGNEYSVFGDKDGVKSGFGEYTADKLPELVGKELAKKIIDSYPEGVGGRTKFTGLDLKLGGEGMKAFYDNIIPSAANKLGKPFDSKVEPIQIDVQPHITDSGINTDTGDIDPNTQGKWATVMSLPVTEKMVEGTRNGVPLFEPKPGYDVKEYQTQEGKTIRFTTDNPDAYIAREPDIQREGDTNGSDSGGEFASVERLITEQKNITLSGDVKITSPEDVAYLFRHLEDASTENAFAVFFDKKGDSKVLYMSTGSTSGTVIDVKLLAAAAKEFNAESVTFVHNHPSGNLKESDDDRRIHERIVVALDGICKVNKGIIINLDSGKFAEFGFGEHDIRKSKQAHVSESEIKIYSFDKQKLYEPSIDRFKVNNSGSVALFLSRMKRGTADKFTVLIVDRQMRVVKAFLTDDISAKILLPLIGKHGDNVIISGNKQLSTTELRQINNQLKAAETSVLDYLHVEQDPEIVSSYHSYADYGELGEPTNKYGNGKLEVNDSTFAGDFLNKPSALHEPEEEYKHKFAGQFLNKAKYVPGVTEVTEHGSKLLESIRTTFSPYTFKVGGKRAAQSMTANLGVMQRNIDMAVDTMKAAKKKFDKYSSDKCLEFIDNMERGNPQSTPELQYISDALRKVLDDGRESVRRLGTGKLENFIENYFPHIWDNPEKASQVFDNLTRRPLEGQKSFLNKRSIEFTKDGVEMGLTPISWNPVVLVLTKIREMERYVMAHRTINELKAEGYIKFVRFGKDRPAGFVSIDDRVGTVMNMNQETHMLELFGHYYAEENAARILNNFLSKGLRGNQVYDLYRGLGNSLTQFQLGLSAFHLGFTSFDAAISKQAIGWEYLLHGRVKQALKSFAEIPISPITTAINGDKLYKAWFGRPSTPEMQMMADIMAQAGGRAKMDEFYQNKFYDRIIENIRNQRYLTAGMQVPLHILELVSKPIMNYIVPRQKMGVFMDMVRYEMTLNPNMTLEQLRDRMQYAWRNVDDRMGQLVYDNLFWNHTVKDIAMGSTRSVGWNLGTFRNIGGALKEAFMFLNDILTIRFPSHTHKLAYFLSLVTTTMLCSALFQYLSTGKKPEELKDYFFPKDGGVDKNGDDTRVSMPTYVKDLYHYKTNPIKTLVDKLNPVNGLFVQMANNKDYYGNKIINEDDSNWQKALETLSYFGDQLKPFGFRNFEKNKYGDATSKILPFFGITPAPYDLNMTPAEKRMSEIIASKQPVGGRTKEQSEHKDLKKDLLHEYKQTGDTSVLGKAIRAKDITFDEGKEIRKQSHLTPIERQAQHLSVIELYSVYKIASDEEKSVLRTIIIKKIRNKDERHTDKVEKEQIERIKKAINQAQ